MRIVNYPLMLIAGKDPAEIDKTVIGVPPFLKSGAYPCEEWTSR